MGQAQCARDHVKLHWLSVRQCIIYKICTMMHSGTILYLGHR